MAAYVLNPWALVLVPAILANLITGVLVLARNPRGRVNQVIAAFQFVVVLWLTGRILMMSATAQNTAAMWSVPLWFFAAMITPVVFHMVLAYGRFLPRFERYWWWTFYLPFLIMFFGLSGGVEPSQYSDWDVIQTWVFKPFGAIMILTLVVGLTMLWWRFTKTHNKLERTQMALMLTGISIAGTVGPFFSLVLPALGFHLSHLGGFSTVSMGVLIGYAVLRYRLFDIEAVTEIAHGSQEISIATGQTYLVKETGNGTSYAMFRSLVMSTPGLCITTFHPEKLRRDHELAKTPIMWITETETEERNVSPFRLDFEILYTLETFMKQNEDTAVIIDDIQYLAMVNGFDKTCEFLRAINDIAAMTSATLIVPVDTRHFSEQEMARLAGTFDETREVATSLFLQHDRVHASYSYMYEEERPEAVARLLRDHAATKMCITKTYPDKFRRRFDLGEMSYYWLTTSKKGDVTTLDPRRLEFELTHIVAEFLRDEHGTVFIHGIEDMVAQNDIKAVAEYLKGIIDIASENQASIVTMVDPGGISPEHLAILESRFDVVKHPSAGSA